MGLESEIKELLLCKTRLVVTRQWVIVLKEYNLADCMEVWRCAPVMFAARDGGASGVRQAARRVAAAAAHVVWRGGGGGGHSCVNFRSSAASYFIREPRWPS